MNQDYHTRAQDNNVLKRLTSYKRRMLKRPTRGERRFKSLLHLLAGGKIKTEIHYKPSKHPKHKQISRSNHDRYTNQRNY